MKGRHSLIFYIVNQNTNQHNKHSVFYACFCDTNVKCVTENTTALSHSHQLESFRDVISKSFLLTINFSA